jgi:hypothetical protein
MHVIYMQPFLSHLAASADPTAELRIVHGKGGRQVAGGAEAYAWQLGFSHVRPLRSSLMNCPGLGSDYGRDFRRSHRDGHACLLPG